MGRLCRLTGLRKTGRTLSPTHRPELLGPRLIESALDEEARHRIVQLFGERERVIEQLDNPRLKRASLGRPII